MWTSSQTIRPGALGAFLAALGALAQPAAAAEEKAAREEVRIAYSIHLGGFEVGEVAMDALVGPASYEARSTLETRGLADALFKSHYDTQAQGAIVEGVVAPATYGSDFRGAGSKTQKVRMSWQAGRPRLDLAEPSYDKARAKRPVSEELQRATVDPLSAMLFVILGSSASADAPCGATVPIYDGNALRARFDDRDFVRDLKGECEDVETQLAEYRKAGE